jgi:hypothetical protein
MKLLEVVGELEELIVVALGVDNWIVLEQDKSFVRSFPQDQREGVVLLG